MFACLLRLTQSGFFLDPEGTLFFNDVSDFSANDTTQRTNYRVSTQQYNDRLYAIVTFYYDDISSPYAKFVGEDPVRSVSLRPLNAPSGPGLRF